MIALVLPETAGDPMASQKWVRSSLRRLTARLRQAGKKISAPTVSRLLRKQDYAFCVNSKQRETGADHPDRNRQFTYIEDQKQAFSASSHPIISVDTKKKELIGNFKNPGAVWGQEADQVNIHDFLSEAQGRASPYGIYDLRRNEGAVYITTSHDTAEFAVTAIVSWWEANGKAHYPEAGALLILTDAGGSDGCRSRLWKAQLQETLCDQTGLTVTVCHYPTGCSKWNPIEHRLFSQISCNWAGKPLHSLHTMVNYLRGTRTTTGLHVCAEVLEGVFETGKKVRDAVMASLNMQAHQICPRWNYTIHPRVHALSPL